MHFFSTRENKYPRKVLPLMYTYIRLITLYLGEILLVILWKSFILRYNRRQFNHFQSGSLYTSFVHVPFHAPETAYETRF